MLRLRRSVLTLVAFVFTVIAVASLLAPDTMARGLGYELSNPTAYNEFRAIYVGLWLAKAVVFVTAARRADLPLLGDLCALMLLGQTVGRLISLVLDGVPDAKIWPVALAEALGALVLFISRPRGRA